MTTPDVLIPVVSVIVLSAAVSVSTQQPPAPLVQESAISAVSTHVHVISDRNVGLVPNVGIIVGSRATLVVDTGLGPRNGQTVLHATTALSTTPDLFVVATHFHPEHALGESAFPANARIVRARAQQQDIDEFGLDLAKTFASRSALVADLLKDAQFRKADILFDREYTLDLGGVRVRLLSLGPTHTRGDTIVWVEGDRVLFAGDVVMNRAFVAFASPYSSVRAWLKDFDELSALNAAVVVPSHGAVGDAALIGAQRTMMLAIQARTVELKRAGKSADDASQAAQSEFQAKYPDWTAPTRIALIARTAYLEAP